MLTFMRLLNRYVMRGLLLTISLYTTAPRPVRHWRRGVKSVLVNWMTASRRPRLTGWW
ncbi:hypothetical protein OV450_6608 [Actinobacteria bacterium OV450]|nr:hypothetical protein OV450_6608 [Actinobacteria bacterium OV450]